MRLIRYLRYVKFAVVLIACLLFVQAFADLSLPRLTSDIVDVGIQQQGIEHVAPDELSNETFQQVQTILDGNDSSDETSLLNGSYKQGHDGIYVLTDYGRENYERLDIVLAPALIEVHGLSQESETLLASAQTPEEKESLLLQQGILAAQKEYQALGYDMFALQMSYLLLAGLKMLGLAALGMGAAIVLGYISARSAAKIGRILRNELFSRVVSFSDTEINQFSAASLITRGTNDIQLVQNVSVMMLRMVLYSPILAIGGIIMVVQTNLQMGWIIVAAIAAVFVLLGILIKVVMPKFKIMQKLIDRVNLVAREMLSGLSVIRAFDREDFEEARFDEASTRLMKTQLFTNRAMTFMMPTLTLIMNGVSVAIVWFGGGFIDAGTLQTGDLIAFITYSMVIIMSFLMLGMISIMLPRADVAAQRVDEVLEATSSIRDPEHPQDEALLNTPGVEIAFHEVSFGYADSKEQVLEDISFVAKPGKITAFIGATGSGKSTIIKLIERFYDVTKGSITLDGIDIRNLTQHALREQLGYVPQKAFLFSGTIESNIAYSDEAMSEEQISQAADIAQASSFISEKEEGFKSEISQGGTNVSGGQRQRLSIARALATNARAYLFDDSFSALDYKTDAALREALNSKLSGRTVLIVAQRIATIMNADHIVVLDEGKIVGQGTHTELMDTCEEYKEIALSQLSAEELKGGVQ